MTDKQRKLWLGAALLGTLALTAYVSTFEDTPEVDAGHLSKRVTSSSQPHQSTTTKLAVTHSSGYSERKMSEPLQDIFLRQKKEEVVAAPKPVIKPEVIQPVVVAPPVVLPPAAPSAPALPFKYIGKYSDQAGLVVFLGYNGKNLMIKAGDVIQQTYRVDEIKPPTLTLTYLPMDVRQVMNIGELN